MAKFNQQGQTTKNQYNADTINIVSSDTSSNNENGPDGYPPVPAWEKIAGLGFGVIFISVILVITVIEPDPSSTQYAIYKTILALAAAGVGGILAGTIHVKGAVLKWTIKAGGAIALFVIVYFFSPSSQDPEVVVNQKINGDNATSIGVNEGVVNIGVEPVKKKEE